MQSVDRAIELHLVDLQRYARSLSKDRSDADELVQDCLVRALSRSHFWSDVRDPRAYLLSIMHNTHVDLIASRRRVTRQIEIDELNSPPSRPASQIATLELRDLMRGLDALPRDQRIILVHVGLNGMSYRDAAAQLGIPLGTVMSRISRARSALRTLLHGEITPTPQPGRVRVGGARASN